MKSRKKQFYANLGNDTVYLPDVVGIFDMDSVTVKKDSRDFLNKSQKAGQIEDKSTDLPLSFVILQKEKEQKVLFTSFAHQTIHSRMKRKFP